MQAQAAPLAGGHASRHRSRHGDLFPVLIGAANVVEKPLRTQASWEGFSTDQKEHHISFVVINLVLKPGCPDANAKTACGNMPLTPALLFDHSAGHSGCTSASLRWHQSWPGTLRETDERSAARRARWL